MANCTRRVVKNPSGPTNRASGRSRASMAKAASISAIVVALSTWICSPMIGAASCRSRNAFSVAVVLAGASSIKGCVEGCITGTTQDQFTRFHLMTKQSTGSKFVCRFAAGDQSGMLCGEWRIWSARNQPDLYVAIRSLGEIKAVVHCPREGRLTFRRHYGFDATAKGPVVEADRARGVSRHKG